MTNLRVLRDKNGISQVDLAKKINATQKSISRWENGYTEIPTCFLKPLSDLLNASFEEILGYPVHENEKIVFKEPDLTFDWYVRQLPRFTNYQISQIIGAGNYIMTRRSDTIKNDEIPETPSQGSTPVKANNFGRGESKKAEEKS